MGSYLIAIVFFSNLYRLIDNYELNHGSFVSTTTIIQGMSSICGPEEEIVSEIKLGRIISSIWGEKVKKYKSSSVNGSGYENLQLRRIEPVDKEKIIEFDGENNRI